MNTKITIVIPAYNEEKTIVQVAREAAKTGYSVVVVDDGSTDRSRFKIKDLKIKNLTLLSHKVNLGKGAAMKTGSEYAFANGADAVIYMDGDGQHEVGDLPKFVDALKSRKYDLVFGSRNLGLGMPLIRYLGNKTASVLVNVLFGIYVTDLVCGYRAVTKKGYQKLNWDSAGYGVETEMIILAAKKKIGFCEVPVSTVYYDSFKGVSILDAIGIFFDVIRWRITK